MANDINNAVSRITEQTIGNADQGQTLHRADHQCRSRRCIPILESDDLLEELELQNGIKMTSPSRASHEQQTASSRVPRRLLLEAHQWSSLVSQIIKKNRDDQTPSKVHRLSSVMLTFTHLTSGGSRQAALDATAS